MGLNQETVDKLIKIAKRETWNDSFYEAQDNGEDVIIDDFAGGNVDDAFDGGYRSGETDMAREVLASLGVEWE